jgi:hypothetical protein
MNFLRSRIYNHPIKTYAYTAGFTYGIISAHELTIFNKNDSYQRKDRLLSGFYIALFWPISIPIIGIFILPDFVAEKTSDSISYLKI